MERICDNHIVLNIFTDFYIFYIIIGQNNEFMNLYMCIFLKCLGKKIKNKIYIFLFFYF